MNTRIAILSNAGGASKTTLTAHIGYALGVNKKTVALLDLDQQGSLSLFTGLKRPQSEDHTSADIFKDNFDGAWDLVPAWENLLEDRCGVLRSNTDLVKTSNELVLDERGPYVLIDRLCDFPLTRDFIIMDCPATLGPIPLAALAASTHVLIPCQLEAKSIQAIAALLNWIFAASRKLRLRPAPKILGVIPTQYDKRVAIHRRLKDELAPVIEQMGIPYFPPIRYSSDFKNASANGLPLHVYRPASPALQDLKKLMMEVENAKEA